MRRLLTLSAFALSLAACTTRDRASSERVGDNIELPVDIQRRIDLLLVLDDSPTMAPKQFALYQGLRGLREVFERPLVNIDYQIAIIASRAGELQSNGECGERLTQLRFLIPSSLDIDDWSCAAGGTLQQMQARGEAASHGPGWHCFENAKALGCGRNEVLLAATRSLRGKAGSWRRQGARLGVIMVSDDQDCSPADSPSPTKRSRRKRNAELEALSCGSSLGAPDLMSISAFRAILSESQPSEMSEVMVAVIAGASDEAEKSANSEKQVSPMMGCYHWDPAHQRLGPESSVQSTLENPRWLGALDPGRLRRLARALAAPGEQALFSICDSDLRRPLSQIAEQFAVRVPPICIPGPRSTVGQAPEPYRLSCLLEGNSRGQRPTAIPECQREEEGGSYRFDARYERFLPPPGNQQCFILRSDRSGKESADPLDNMSARCRAQDSASELWVQGYPERATSSTRWTLRCSPVMVRDISRPLASGLLSPVRRFGKLLSW